MTLDPIKLTILAITRMAVTSSSLRDKCLLRFTAPYFVGTLKLPDSAKLKTQSEIPKQNILAKLKLAKDHVLRITKSPAAVQITAESD